MSDFQYQKSCKYTDLDTIYAQCSGPGGLQLAEFIAEKMGLTAGKKLLDVGTNRGYQTCFLAKEYGVFAVGIDPWNDREQGNPMVDHLMQNAKDWGVEDAILAIKIGVPETNFADNSFDFIYSTTALEMFREISGEEAYLEALKELYRVLKPGGIFGLGEPMHYDVAIPPDLVPILPDGYRECFRTLAQSLVPIKTAGFEIIEADYAPDAQQWWLAFAEHDPFCKKDPEGEPKFLKLDNGRWTSFGYMISRKPVS